MYWKASVGVGPVQSVRRATSTLMSGPTPPCQKILDTHTTVTDTNKLQVIPVNNKTDHEPTTTLSRGPSASEHKQT